MEVSGKLYAPATLPPKKEPPVTIVGRLGGHQRRSERYGIERNLLPLAGIVADPSSLSVYRLNYEHEYSIYEPTVCLANIVFVHNTFFFTILVLRYK
jgi:hypothetical protein